MVNESVKLHVEIFVFVFRIDVLWVSLTKFLTKVALAIGSCKFEKNSILETCEMG